MCWIYHYLWRNRKWGEMWRNRKLIYSIWLAKRKLKECGKLAPHALKPGLEINNNTYFKDNVCIAHNLTVLGEGKFVVGSNVHFGHDCLVVTQNHNYETGKALPYDATNVLKDVIIGDNVWIGDRVTIVGKVNIGEGAVVQANSTVVKDIPALSVCGGHPAVPFKYRDKKHYEDLKKKKSFH